MHGAQCTLTCVKLVPEDIGMQSLGQVATEVASGENEVTGVTEGGDL